MHYRNITIKDYEMLIEFWKKVPGITPSGCDGYEAMDIFLDRNAGLSLACEDEGKNIIATILCGYDGRRGYLYHLAVSKEYRKQGIGKKLLDMAIDLLKEKGIEKCHLFVNENNPEAKKFYKAAGWLKRDDICVFSKDIWYTNKTGC